MPARSKVITMLPHRFARRSSGVCSRTALETTRPFAQWVRGQGHEISDDSLWRYGHSLQQQLTAMRLTVRLARFGRTGRGP